jgi:hypothetical protein
LSSESCAATRGDAREVKSHVTDWLVFYAAPDGHLQQFHVRTSDWEAGTEAI